MWSSRGSFCLAVGKCLLISCVTWIFHSILAHSSSLFAAPTISTLASNEISSHTIWMQNCPRSVSYNGSSRAKKKSKKRKNLIETRLNYESMCLHAASIRVSFATNKAESRAALCDICKGERSRTQFNRQFLKSRAKCVKCPAKSQQFWASSRPSAAPAIKLYSMCDAIWLHVSLIPPIRSVSYIFWQKIWKLCAREKQIIEQKSWNSFAMWRQIWSIFAVRTRHASIYAGSWPRLAGESFLGRASNHRFGLNLWIYFFIWWTGGERSREKSRMERENIN